MDLHTAFRPRGYLPEDFSIGKVLAGGKDELLLRPRIGLKNELLNDITKAIILIFTNIR